jgi:hypothetical protein
MKSLKSSIKSEITCLAPGVVQIAHTTRYGYTSHLQSIFAFLDRNKLFSSTGKLLSAALGIFTRDNYTGCFVIVILNSLNYSVTRRKRRLRLQLHFAKRLALPIPQSVLVRIFKRRICLFGFPEAVLPFAYTLINMRRYDIYTGYGVRMPNSGTKKKPGKVRIR